MEMHLPIPMCDLYKDLGTDCVEVTSHNNRAFLQFKGPVGGILDPLILLLSILLLIPKFRTAKTASLYVLSEAR